MRYLYAFLLFGLLSVQALPARAQTTSASGPIISEINWAGSALSQADEWIELYNPTSAGVDLSGWILTGSASSGEALALPDGTFLAAGATLLIANYELGNEKSTLATPPDLITASLSLSNSTQQIFLTMPDGTVVDSVGEGGKPMAGSTNPIASMERNLTNLSWSTATTSYGLNDPTQLGTPGSVGTTQTVANVEPELEPTVVEQASTEVTEEEPSIELTSEQLANCYALYMPQTVRVEPQDTTESSDPSDNESESAEESTVESDQKETVSTEITQQTTSLNETTSDVDSPTAYTAGVVLINEVVSDPQDGPEWVELFNASNTVVDLTGWTLTEGSGKKTNLPEMTLGAGEYLVIESIKGNLNNDGDSLVLSDGTGTEIDTMSYDKTNAPKKGESLALTAEGQWSITTMMSRGSVNTFSQITDTMYEDLSSDDESTDTSADSQTQLETIPTTNQNGTGAADVVSDQSKVHQIVAVAKVPKSEGTSATKKTTSAKSTSTTLEGVITALPGTFGAQIAFIDGMQLYFHHADWPELSVGDRVVVSGEPSTASGESRVKIAKREDILIIGSESIDALSLTTLEALTQDIGSLVRVSGSIKAINGDDLTLADNVGEITIVANKHAGISWSDLSSSAYTFTGVIRTRGGEVELYVRSWEDVAALAAEQVIDESTDGLAGITNGESDSSPWIGAIIVATSVGTVVYWFVRYKLMPQQSFKTATQRLNTSTTS